MAFEILFESCKDVGEHFRFGRVMIAFQASFERKKLLVSPLEPNQNQILQTSSGGSTAHASHISIGSRAASKQKSPG